MASMLTACSRAAYFLPTFVRVPGLHTSMFPSAHVPLNWLATGWKGLADGGALLRELAMQSKPAPHAGAVSQIRIAKNGL